MHTRLAPMLAFALWGAAAAQQAPTVLAAPSDLLSQMHLRAGTVQALTLPLAANQPLEVSLSIGGVGQTLLLRPHDVRAPGFQLLIDDGVQLRQVATPASVTFRGEVRGLAGTDVAASLIDGQLTATIHLADRTQWSVQPISTVNPALPRDTHMVYREADVIRPRVSCGVNGHVHGIQHGAGQGGGVGPAAIKICEIAIDADLPFYNRFGSNATNVQNQVTTVMNSTGVIYRRDTEIDYVITTIIVRTTAIYNWGGSVNTLLTQFQNHWIANHTNIQRDVAHLFTGEGTFSGVVGLAFVGAICETFGYGLSKAYDTNLANNVALVAHEVGHNWNANHCDASPPCNIMCSSIGGCNNNGSSFDQGTINTIVAFKNSRTCLSDPGTGGGTWNEAGDAGSQPSEAQAPTGTGALATINGAIGVAGDVDVYMIRVANEAQFSATTIANGPTLNDTQLFLFDATGRPIACNDDSGSGARSTIDSTLVTANGVYFLVVSSYDVDPTNNGSLIFPNTTTGQIAPNANTGPMNGQSATNGGTGTYAISLTGCEVTPATHTEIGDAGDLLHTAQAPCKVGPLTSISGTFGAGDVDVYRIFIDSPTTFSASTCGGSTIDTQLFLFTLDGRGVACNDDLCNAQSTITNSLVVNPGVYYLAISEYDRDPVSAGGLIFPNTSTGQIGPTGPGGSSPFLGWTGSTAGTGAYTITLTGCSHGASALARLYGNGVGSGPGVPTLTLTTPTQLGNNSGLTLTNPDATAAGMALILGQSRAAVPILNGTLLVGDIITILSLPAPALGPNNIGPFRLATAPNLCGSRITWQAVIVVAPTPNFPTGLTWTAGIEWTLGL